MDQEAGETARDSLELVFRMSNILETDVRCKRCGMVETVDHVLLLCDYAQRVWELAPIQISPLDQGLYLRTFLDAAKYFVDICWTLWTSRNQLVFENRAFSEEETVTTAVIDDTKI